MHQGTRVVFDEMINAEAGLTLYTSLLHTDFLSNAHQLGLHAIFSTSATSGTYIISVHIQHSADGRNWLDKNKTPELSGLINLTPGVGEWSVMGGENSPPLPRLRFVMLAINVTTRGVSPPASRLQLLATARTRTMAALESEVAAARIVQPSRREAMARLLGMRPSTLEEVEMHVRDARVGDGLGRLTDRLSPAARSDLLRLTRIFRELDPTQKRAALTFAGALASLAMLAPENPDNSSSPSLA